MFVACEFSGIVREEFKKRGHDAWSCDLLPTEIPGQHIQDDCLNHLNDGWDVMIAFPPCTDICSAGAVYWKQKVKDGRQAKAINFVAELSNCNINKIAIENPVGILSQVWRKPDQIINPYNFGDPYLKKTCLWLKNLPPLIQLINPREVIPTHHWHSGAGYHKKQGVRIKSKLPGIHRDSRKRSLTFPGIAKAMAEQWG